MQSEDFPSHIYEVCWALIYLSDKDSTLKANAAHALSSFRLKDGTYRANRKDKTASVYATVMAAWALSQSTDDEKMLVDETRKLE